MTSLLLDRPAGVLVKTTLVDFPGRTAGSFFLKGCNLRCPYCYNTELVLEQPPSGPLNTVQELFAHLEKRKGVLSGLVISGGEPTLSPYTPVIIQKAKELGYKVKLDTNGLLPKKLAEFLADERLRPDFIAMDVKTAPLRYKELFGSHAGEINMALVAQNLAESVGIISRLPQDSREFRTVLVPPLVTQAELEQIAALLPKDASWQLAQFQGGSCLDPAYSTLLPYSDEEAARLAEYAAKLIPGAKLR